jgi:ATP-binding cassette subfamily F protein uup
MDNVVTSLLVLEGDGVVSEHAGGYSDWDARGGRLQDRTGKSTAEPTTPRASKDLTTSAVKKAKLSYKDQRERDSLPGIIESLEQRQQALEDTISQSGFYQGNHDQVQQVLAELADVETEMETTFERWAELEG